MAKPKQVTCCPHCKRIIRAKDYFGNLLILGFLDSVLPHITCACGYYGLPIELKVKEYEKWVSREL